MLRRKITLGLVELSEKHGLGRLGKAGDSKRKGGEEGEDNYRIGQTEGKGMGETGEREEAEERVGRRLRGARDGVKVWFTETQPML